MVREARTTTDDWMQFYWLVLATLAVWRVTHLLNAEDGPWDIVVRVRKRAGRSLVGRLLDCFYCLSLWISLPAAVLVGQGAKEIALLWLALSAGAIALERLTNRKEAPAPAIYYEHDPGADQEVLRQEEGGADRGSAEPH